MTSDTIWNEIRKVLRHTLGQPELEITRSTEAIDVPGWDSLSHTIILIELEKGLGIRLPLERLPDLGSVVALADLLEELVFAKSGPGANPSRPR